MFSVDLPSQQAYDDFRRVLEEVSSEFDSELMAELRKTKFHPWPYEGSPVNGTGYPVVPLTREMVDAYAVESTHAEWLKAKMISLLGTTELSGKIFVTMQDIRKGRNGRGEIIRQDIGHLFVVVTPKEYLGLMAVTDCTYCYRTENGGAQIPVSQMDNLVSPLVKLIQEGVCL